MNCINNDLANEACTSYAIYSDAFDARLRAARGLPPVADSDTQVKGLRALVRCIDAMVATGRGAQCAVTISWEGGEPSRVMDAAQRREMALAKIASLEAGE